MCGVRVQSVWTEGTKCVWTEGTECVWAEGTEYFWTEYNVSGLRVLVKCHLFRITLSSIHCLHG